jgi:hypothetical protein
MSRANRILITVGMLVLGVAGFRAALVAAEEEGRASVKIRFPREESVTVGLTCNKVELRSVRIDGAPSRHDVHEAREHHSSDTTNLRWIFKCGNEGKHPRKVTIKVKIFAEDNDVLGEDSRTDTISGEKDKDQISVWTKIRTRDYAKADHARISAECERE